MIPILYEANETAFRSNGIGRLVDCLRCEVTEERNGIFEVEFDYPITGQLYDEIIEGRIIAAIHDDNKDVQPFDIYGRSAPIDGIVTFYAHHVSYRLQYSILQPFTASSVSAAFAQMATKCVTPCPFTFWTDKTTSGTFTVAAPVSVKEILGGVQGSILDVFGKGDYEWDGFTVKLYLNRGQDTGVQIRYGKNLVNLTQDLDTSGFYSAVVPFWQGGDDNTLVTLPEWVVQSTAASGGSVPSKAVPLDLSDQWEEAPTVAQLRARALDRVNSSEAWLPDENIKVDFVALWQTDEYANIAPLERVRLCDRVSVIVPELGLTAEGVQVIKVVYNSLEEKYESMELGTARTSFADVVQAAAEESIMKEVPSKSYLQSVKDKLSEEINAGTDGIIVDVMNANGKRSEILILCDEGVTEDTPPENCQHIWRINKAGIAYSSDYGHTYNLAITASGQIVADFITAGALNANIITSGVIRSNDGNVYFDLDGNELVCSRMRSTNSDIGAYQVYLDLTDVDGTNKRGTLRMMACYNYNYPNLRDDKPILLFEKQSANGASAIRTGHDNGLTIQDGKSASISEIIMDNGEISINGVEFSHSEIDARSFDLRTDDIRADDVYILNVRPDPWNSGRNRIDIYGNLYIHGSIVYVN